MAISRLLLLSFLAVSSILADSLPSSFPHVYPGKPIGDYSPAWQKYFQVTSPLPNITFPLPRSFAGNIGVQRAGHPNNTLFFWGLEKKPGSLTALKSNDPWGIWLNGGPGSSSMVGFFLENGPVRIDPNGKISANKFSWDTVADYFWIDQPVGTGFSTADAAGYIADEDQMGADFMGFLANLVKVFPSLATRPLHLTGESYAGVYIPYIMKARLSAYFSMAKPPVQIAKVVIGDGAITTAEVFELLPTLNVIETYPQLIGYDPEVYKYFKEQYGRPSSLAPVSEVVNREHLCGFDINLTYPQNGVIPSVKFIGATDRDVPYLQRAAMKNLAKRGGLMAEIHRRYAELEPKQRQQTKRDLSLRANGTLDPWYGCALLPEFIDYALNYSAPWNFTGDAFNVYDITDPFGSPGLSGTFLNDPRTRAALHAPTSKDWEQSFEFVFGDLEDDPSPPPMNFLTEFATNATKHKVSVILYSGNDDALIAHRGTEVTIQNTTFGGIQGFTRKPSTVWRDDSGKPAGIVHQERGWSYVLFNNTGHLIPAKTPAAALTFAREFVFGNNPTGTVSSANIAAVGGETAELIGAYQNVIPGSDGIVYQNAAGDKTSTFVYPSATIAAWNTFIRGQTRPPPAAPPAKNAHSTSSSPSSASQHTVSWIGILVALGSLWLL
ncbi:Carboxypeptidase [Mycena indigotica]|uniref:Carboxypeptidase n=1 Tax=Mycena indigotica TaxID=2126181 RepID=A0A8H6T327_9AGAR|nr:Carboxypeptidase [Mycena indigotica]KAF7309994.1 Carboxypeptidase [Mycena indigotica]